MSVSCNVSFVMSKDKVSLMLKGKLCTVNAGTSQYVDVITAIREGKSEDEIYEYMTKELSMADYVDRQGNSRVTLRGDTLYVDGEQLHGTLADRVVDFKNNNLPIEHLIRFVERIEDNPSYNSRNQLYDFLEHKDLVITEDGYFLAYKGLQLNYLDRYSSTIDNSPGKTIRMDRSKIDDNPNSHCSKGLHVGAISYATGWAKGKVVIVKVDPANVVSVPNDWDCQKCRVCEYTVLRDADGIMKQPLYTTTGEPFKPETYTGDWDFADDDTDDVFDEGEVYSYDDDDECYDDDGYCNDCGECPGDCCCYEDDDDPRPIYL